MSADTVEVRSRGLVTIPKAIREANNIQEGQQYSVQDLGQGVLLFSPRVSQINAICNDLRDTLLQRGATLEGMLAELRRIREAGDA
jgi:AbrB family looped-hinge helix DNA binding protein